mmetsp:Transcript_8588/g.15725  ORF Transcript_8588/g.15725 Transcript_8588/m.15725 type:complete len:234 (+) Transcript_8588:651-1352(+)
MDPLDAVAVVRRHAVGRTGDGHEKEGDGGLYASSEFGRRGVVSVPRPLPPSLHPRHSTLPRRHPSPQPHGPLSQGRVHRQHDERHHLHGHERVQPHQLRTDDAQEHTGPERRHRRGREQGVAAGSERHTGTAVRDSDRELDHYLVHGPAHQGRVGRRARHEARVLPRGQPLGGPPRRAVRDAPSRRHFGFRRRRRRKRSVRFRDRRAGSVRGGTAPKTGREQARKQTEEGEAG